MEFQKLLLTILRRGIYTGSTKLISLVRRCPLLGAEQGSRGRIPHKAVAVWAELLSTYVTERNFGKTERAWTPKSEDLPAYDAHNTSPVLRGCSAVAFYPAVCQLYPFGMQLFCFPAHRPKRFFTSFNLWSRALIDWASGPQLPLRPRRHQLLIFLENTRAADECAHGFSKRTCGFRGPTRRRASHGPIPPTVYSRLGGIEIDRPKHSLHIPTDKNRAVR